MMEAPWYEPGSRKWLIFGTLLWLMVELILRPKLGTVYVLVVMWSLIHQWLSAVLGRQSVFDPGQRLVRACYWGFIICGVIFAAFGVVNIGLRTIDPSWRWFQLP